MARISLNPPRTPLYRLVEWYSRRRYGDMLDPGKALAHNSRVLFADLRFERAVAKLGTLDPVLKELAVMTAAAAIGCSWCMDFGYYESVRLGADARKVRDVARWRDSDAYDDVERAVLAYSEAATASPAAVGPEVVEELRRHLDEAQVVELAAWVALENLRSRFNAGLGLHTQGFSDHCEVPLALGRT